MASLCSLLPAEASDAEAIVRGVDVPSMLNGPLFRIMFPTYSTVSAEEREKMVQWHIDGLERALENPVDGVYLKVCELRCGDSAEEQVQLPPLGFCGWEIIDRKCLGLRALDQYDSGLNVEVTEGKMNIMIRHVIVPASELIEAVWALLSAASMDVATVGSSSVLKRRETTLSGNSHSCG